MSRREKKGQKQLDLEISGEIKDFLNNEHIAFEEAILLIRDKLHRKKLRSELFTFTVFLILFLVQLFLARDVRAAYEIEQVLKNAFVETEIVGSRAFKTLLTVQNVNEVWSYLLGPFASAMSQTKYYNGQNLSAPEVGTIQWSNKIVGPARIRQLRVKSDACSLPTSVQSLYGTCSAVYDGSTKDTAPFGPGNIYTYSGPEDAKGVGLFGRQTSGQYFDGGGYLVNIPIGGGALSAIQNLKANSFIDRQTRALVITVNTINVNLNHFALTTLLIEFSSSGTISPFAQFKVFLADPSLGSTAILRFIAEGLMIILLIYFVISNIREALKADSFVSYLLAGWNLFDFMNLLIFWLVVIYDIIFIASSPLASINLNSTTYVSELEPTAEIYTQVFNLQAFNILITFVKTFKFLQMNDRMSLLWKTLSKASGDLSAFFIFFSIVFMAFSTMSHILFGGSIYEYRDLLSSMITCFRMILGSFDYNNITGASLTLGPIFFVLFVILVYFTLANMFLAIINDAYAFVKFHNEEARSLYDTIKGQKSPGGLCGAKPPPEHLTLEEMFNTLKMHESQITGVLHIDSLAQAMGRDFSKEDANFLLFTYNAAKIKMNGKALSGKRKDPETEIENRLTQLQEDYERIEGKVDWLLQYNQVQLPAAP